MPYPQIDITVKYKGGGKTISPIVDSTEVAAKIIRAICNKKRLLWTEEMLMICMGATCKLQGWYRVHIGGMNAMEADTRVIATIAAKCAASNVIIAHNHPGGGLVPSREDIEATMA